MGTSVIEQSKRRDKGEGSIWYNGEKKRWYAQLSLGWDENGKKIRKTVSASNKSEVILKMRDAIRGDNTLVEMNKRHQPLPDKIDLRKQNLLKDYMKTYLNLYKRPVVTARTFEWCINMSKYIINELGDYDIFDITSMQLQNFLNSLAFSQSKKKKTLSQKSIKGIVMMLKQTFEFAMQQRDIYENPFDRRIVTPKPKVKLNETPKALPTEMLKQIFLAVDSSKTYKPIIYTLFYTGIRIGELLALRWEDLDELNGVIHIKRSLVKESIIDEDLKTTDRILTVTKTKTNASVRIIPVDNFLFGILNEWREYVTSSKELQKKIRKNKTSDYIFLNQNGELRSYDGLRRQFGRFLEEKGIDPEGITFHRFRHTYATLLIENGTNPRIVQELLGHRDVQTTLSIYTSVSIEAMMQATKDFGKIAADVINSNSQMNKSVTYIL